MDPATGGPSQGIKNILPAITNKGVNTEVVSLDDPTEEFVTKQTFKIYALGKATNKWGYHKKLLPWLIKYLCEYDVVIIHGLWLYHGYAVYKAMRVLVKTHPNSVPRIYLMPHGMLDPYFQKAESRRLKAFRNVIYWHIIQSKVINSATGMLFTCKEELLLARTTFTKYKPKLEYNIGYGIQPPPPKTDTIIDAFYQKLPNIKNKPFLLFISRIHPKKGVEYILDAYKSINEKSSKTELPELVIIGPGITTSYGNMLKKKVNQSKYLTEHVHFLGMVQGDAKWGAIYACDAFILPSHQENFGIAVVEALSCKKPVLISNQVNIFSEIETEGGGIVASDTLDGTIKLLNTWQALTVDEKDKMGEAARTTYEKYFNIGIVSKKIIDGLWDQKPPDEI